MLSSDPLTIWPLNFSRTASDAIPVPHIPVKKIDFKFKLLDFIRLVLLKTYAKEREVKKSAYIDKGLYVLEPIQNDCRNKKI